MEFFLALLGLGLAAAWFVLAIWAIVISTEARQQSRALAERVARLEKALAAGPIERAPEPVAVPVAAPAVTPAPAPRVVAPVVPPRSAMTVSRLEELIGSVWLQNVGSVLLLVGVFFLILWGYSTGRLGPGALVAAGIVTGLGFLWRGDRVTRTTPAFGHALLGIGLGIVYLSLYVGHVRLGVLPRIVALTSLVAVSIGSVLLGLRYRVQSIAALGVIGAYIPPLLGAWIPLVGFALAPDTLLAYLAGVGLSVYALSARAGWSRLDLAAVILASLTWASSVNGVHWGWHTEIGLALLYVALGLAPLPALLRRPGAPRPSDLAVIALTPFLFVLLSLPFAISADRNGVAALALSLAALYTVVALWMDTQRQERDLWKPITGAAVLFLSLGLQRWVGDRSTALAWSLEGVLLVSFGLWTASGWLRACGTLVAAASSLALAVRLGESWTANAGILPFLRGDAIRDLGSIAALPVGGHVLGRERERLASDERMLAEVWTFVGNLALAVWLARECLISAGHLARNALLFPSPWDLAMALTAVAWTAQAAVLILRGLEGRPFLRWLAYVAAAVVAFTGLTALPIQEGGLVPSLLHPVTVLWLATLGALMVLAHHLASRRAAIEAAERWAPEGWTLAVALLWMAWMGREADHLASASGEAERRVRTLSAALTSAGWLIEGITLTVLGWVRASAFMRWAGLGLFGVTVLKILLVDLQTVDVFWRFFTAVLAGVALLAVSYAYQRKRRLENIQPKAEPSGPST